MDAVHKNFFDIMENYEEKSAENTLSDHFRFGVIIAYETIINTPTSCFFAEKPLFIYTIGLRWFHKYGV
jgi:hypothetical protein